MARAACRAETRFALSPPSSALASSPHHPPLLLLLLISGGQLQELSHPSPAPASAVRHDARPLYGGARLAGPTVAAAQADAHPTRGPRQRRRLAHWRRRRGTRALARGQRSHHCCAGADAQGQGAGRGAEAAHPAPGGSCLSARRRSYDGTGSQIEGGSQRLAELRIEPSKAHKPAPAASSPVNSNATHMWTAETTTEFV